MVFGCCKRLLDGIIYLLVCNYLLICLFFLSDRDKFIDVFIINGRKIICDINIYDK